MKKLIVIACLFALSFASDFVPKDKIESLANRLVNQKLGAGYRLEVMIPYYGVDELPNAYALIYRGMNDEPFTIVMGARYTTSPVCEIRQSPPRHRIVANRIRQEARILLGGEPEFSKVYYWGPCEEYVGFKSDKSEVLVNAYSLKRVDKQLFRAEPDKELEGMTRDKWNKYFQAIDFTTRQTGYIDSVPFIDWVYGCTPTAASMMFWYWDARNYGKLVDFFFTHWDYPEGEWNDCANVNRELAFAMNTDTMSGGTYLTSYVSGVTYVANSINGYSFTAQLSPQGGTYNQFVFSWLKTEIDNQRPAHWSILHYQGDPNFNHSVTGVGYDIIAPDTFVIVHDTWDTGEPLWPLWTYMNGYQSYDYVGTLVPGGANTNNAFLDYPLGADAYSIPTVFANIKYNIKWNTVGSNIDHLKLWYSRGNNAVSYDSLNWTLITNNASNTGRYTWTCPSGALGCSVRVNISALNASNTRLAADGSFGRSLIRDPAHSPEVNLAGHYDTPGWANDVALAGDYGYIADGTNGLTVVNISDSSLPDYYSHLVLPGNSFCIAVNGSYLYIGDREDTLRVISIANPLNPVQVGKCALTDEVLDVFVKDTLVFVAARSQGLVIVNAAVPASPVVIGTLNTAGLTYDVFVDGNYAYIADATQGARVVNISNPASPVETGFNNTNGICYGITKSGNFVYAADGNMGIKVFDASNPDTLIQLGALDTPTSATKVQYWNNLLYVADGAFGGIRAVSVVNPSSPAEIGYIQSYGSAGNLRVSGGNMLYLADGSIGLILITSTLTGINEGQRVTLESVKMCIKPMPTLINKPITISLIVTEETRVEVKLLDCSGRLVETIYQGVIYKGNNDIHWQPKDIPSGIYFIEQNSDNTRNIQKLVLVK